MYSTGDIVLYRKDQYSEWSYDLYTIIDVEIVEDQDGCEVELYSIQNEWDEIINYVEEWQITDYE